MSEKQDTNFTDWLETTKPLLQSFGYVVQRLLGYGSYGIMFQCIRSNTQDLVSVKAIPKCFADFGLREVYIHKKLEELDQAENNLIQIKRYFKLNGNLFLEFERLDVTLGDLLKRFNRPLHLSEIQMIAQQLLVALNALKSIRIIHGDIRLENIMIRLEPFKVMLIEFGQARAVSEMGSGDSVYPLKYRAPEVLLGLPLSEPVDMWALGCLMVLMYIKADLYSGLCELAKMEDVVQFHGRPENHLLRSGIHTGKFFVESNGRFELKTECTCSSPSVNRFIRGIHLPLRDSSSTQFTSLDNIAMTRPDTANCADTIAFVNFLKKMLQVDPEKRITPSKALRHPFMILDHFPSDFFDDTSDHELTAARAATKKDLPVPDPSYVTADYENENTGSDRGKLKTKRNHFKRIIWFLPQLFRNFKRIRRLPLRLFKKGSSTDELDDLSELESSEFSCNKSSSVFSSIDDSTVVISTALSMNGSEAAASSSAEPSADEEATDDIPPASVSCLSEASTESLEGLSEEEESTDEISLPLSSALSGASCHSSEESSNDKETAADTLYISASYVSEASAKHLDDAPDEEERHAEASPLPTRPAAVPSSNSMDSIPDDDETAVETVSGAASLASAASANSMDDLSDEETATELSSAPLSPVTRPSTYDLVEPSHF